MPQQELVEKKSIQRQSDSIEHDHDTWIENFAVTESIFEKGKPMLRPYFESVSNGTRVWGEPPSGASNIQYATSHTREMANRQLQDYIDREQFLGFATYSTSAERKGFLGRIRRRFPRKNKENDQDREKEKIQNITKGMQRVSNRDMQAAIAMSLNQNMSQNKNSDQGIRKDDQSALGSTSSQNIEEDMDMAVALSLSMRQVAVNDNVEGK